MPNPFDHIKHQVFDHIAVTMGYDAICRGVKARVLYNCPAEKEAVGSHDYSFERPTLEFREGDWPGIKQAIEAKENVLIEIEGKQYYALKIVGNRTIARDGETYQVILEAAR